MPRISKALKSKIRAKINYDAFYGQEPASLGKEFYTKDMGKYLTWYSALGEVKKLRKYIIQYMKDNKYSKKQIETIELIHDNDITITLCSLCRMITNKCNIGKSENYIKEKIKELINSHEVVVIPETVKFNNHNNQLICDTEDLLDEYYRSEYKNAPIDYFKFILERQSKLSDVKECVDYYQPLLDELLNEDNNLTRKQNKSYISFVEKLIEDAKTYLTNGKKERKLTRKPRKKKIKSADQLSSKVKFKASDTKLKITSIPPSNIIGANSVWFFNTKYKKLTYLVAKPNESLAIKGTTILGFDTKNSVCKTIRKPEQNLTELLNMGKIAMVKAFLKLKTKNSTAKGRLNADVLILKASK
jgi:hypothetical protein